MNTFHTFQMLTISQDSLIIQMIGYMTDDSREAGIVYPRFSVRFVTWRMILERQQLFTPGFQWGSLHDGWSYRDRNCLPPVFSAVRYMTDDHREAGTVYPRFLVRFVTWRMILETGTVYPRFAVRFVTWRWS